MQLSRFENFEKNGVPLILSDVLSDTSVASPRVQHEGAHFTVAFKCTGQLCIVSTIGDLNVNNLGDLSVKIDHCSVKNRRPH